MPFDENINVLTVTGDRVAAELPVKREVTTGEVIGATFADDHTVTNLANDFADWAFNSYTPDPDYDATEDMAGYEGYADDLIHAVSREDMARRKQRIDDEMAAKETIAQSSGLQSFGAATLTAVTDPVSWIPIGGPAYKTYRTGGNLLEGAAKTAGVAAIIETGREAYMQETQATRTFEQSASNIASVTLLTGLLGGAASIVSPKQQAQLVKAIDDDMNIPDLSSVGAMQAGTTAEQETIKGLEKTQAVFRKIPDALTNPVYRGSTSESKVVRQITEQLADTSLIKNKNTEFIASATSVENKIKGYDVLKLGFYRDFTPQWKAYRKRVAEQKKAGGIPAEERIGSKKDGSLTWREFSEEVTKASRRNDSHLIPEVQTVAQSWRRHVGDPGKKRMVDTGLLDDYDIDVKTADSWIRRMWDRDKILSDRQAFKDINTEWLRKKRDAAAAKLDDFKSTNAKLIKDKDPKITKELEQLKLRAAQMDEEIDDIADQIIDRIVGLPGGRLGYDIKLEGRSKGPQKVGARGSAKARVYDIPDELVENYLVNDIHAITESYVRTTAADAELMDTFGTLDFDVVKRQVTEDYNRLIFKEKDAAKTKKLEAAKRKDITDLQAMWDKLRGLYAQPDDYAAPQHVAERAFLAWNYARLLGGMTLSAVPDMGRHVMVHGMQRVMGDGIAAMMTDFKGFKAATADLREASIGLDMALSTTARARANIDEFTPVSGRVDAVSQTVAQNFGNVTLMNQWNTAQKTFAGILTQTRMLRAIQDVAKGKAIDAKEIENLASHGIDRDAAKAIAKQFKEHGETRQRVLVPNAREWADAQAANLFRAAVRKQVDEIIVTPGLDRPLWMSRPGWRLVGQFRSFAFASMQRVTMAGLQQADAAAVGGVMMMIGMGAMVYGTKTVLAGREVSDDPRVWLTEGIDRSGITGWFFDVNNITEKATRGTVGINALIGGPQMSRYASRNVIDSIAGPTLGLSQDFFTLTGAAASRDWKESDTHAMRRLLPYQNVIYLRGLFDQMENGVNQTLGVQQ
ncbi:MAG: hypothetical protein ACPGQQ_00835 [Candidatus Puniceispirillaceae bacterium]